MSASTLDLSSKVEFLSPTVRAVLEHAAALEKREISPGDFGYRMLGLISEANQLRDRWLELAQLELGSALPPALSQRLLALQGLMRAGAARRWNEFAEQLQRLSRADHELLQASTWMDSAA